MSKLLLSTLTAIATTGALLSAPVFAATETTAAPTVITANQAQTQKQSQKQAYNQTDRSEWMSIKQVAEALEKAGYKEADIKSIKTKRDGYKVKLYNAEGQKTRLMVHPTDGTVSVYEKRKDGRKGDGKKSYQGKRDQSDR